MGIRRNQEWFTSTATNLHNDKYCYDKSIYTGIKHKLIVTCKEHGDWNITPDCHINKKRGCPLCGLRLQVSKRTYTTPEIIDIAISVHGDRYLYNKVHYKSYHKKIVITCKEHGDFEQAASSHIAGSGCPKCKLQKLSTLYSKNNDWFIEKSKEIHNDRYLYNKVDYKNNSTPVLIICKIHGNFKQRPSVHLKGANCPFCMFDKSSTDRTLTIDEFLIKAKSIHGDKYSYNKSIYISNAQKVIITCLIHGDYLQIPNSHCAGNGCPKCANRGPSKSEIYIMKLLNDNNIKYVFQKRFPDCRNPITNYMLIFDFYLPEFNILIEYDGAQHFMEIKNRPWGPLEYIQYKDSIKNEYCIKNNVRLIRISYIENIKNRLMEENII